MQDWVDDPPDGGVRSWISPSTVADDAGSAETLGMKRPSGSEASSMQVQTVWRQEADVMLRVAQSLRAEAQTLPAESVLRRQLEDEADDWLLHASMRSPAPA